MSQTLRKPIKNFGSMLLTVIFVVTFFSLPVQAQQKEHSEKYIKIEVDGLACPFCAYGIEKNLRNNIEGLDDLDINIEKGYVSFGFPKQTKLKDEKVRKIVKDAGFEAKKISFSDKPFTKEDDNK